MCCGTVKYCCKKYCCYSEPYPRGSARSPSPCGSNTWLYFFPPSPFRGCCLRIGCREWVERVGGRLFSWKADCLGKLLPVYVLGNQQPTTTSRRGAGQPRRNGVIQFLQPHMGPVFGRDVSFWKTVFGLVPSKFLFFWSIGPCLSDTGWPFWARP
jgi:hypothetical protein